MHRLDDGLVSGGVPDGDAGFDALKAMGIRTIITVDGAPPDVARAEARGMRYVHIPITYAQVSPEQTLELARAVRDLPGPTYIHATTASIGALPRRPPPHRPRPADRRPGGGLPEEGGDRPELRGALRLRRGGGSPRRPARSTRPPPTSPRSGSPRASSPRWSTWTRPSSTSTPFRAAGWAVPADHPDLVPAAEAGRLADDLRLGAEDPRAAARSPDLVTQLRAAAEEAAAPSRRRSSPAPPRPTWRRGSPP